MTTTISRSNQSHPEDPVIDDVLISNTTVWASNVPSPQNGWLTVKDGRISAVGTDNMPPPNAKHIIDGKDKSVLPSFVDCHTHISAAALINISKNGSAWRCKDDALNTLEQVVAADSSTEWLVFFFVDWDSWTNPTPPTAQELELASGGRNVLIVCESLHRGILSETALRTSNLTQFLNGRFIETSHGIPNGVVWEESFSACLLVALTSIIEGLGNEGLKHVMLAETQRHLAYGITDAHDPSMTFAMSQVMSQVNEQSPLRISWSEVGSNGPISSAGIGEHLEHYGTGPSSAKIFTDGAHRCAMCIDAGTAFNMGLKIFVEALSNFSLAPIRRLLTGDMAYSKGKFYRQGALFTPPELTDRLQSLGESHERLKIHALGNHAVDMACDCIVEAGLTTKVCLEHATLIDDHNIEKIAKHNIQVSMQPGFLPHFGDMFMKMHLGEKYRGLAARSMLDAGINLIMSSDNPCGPLDPLHNIRCAVERTLPDKRIYLEKEAVTQQEAIYAYTIAGTSGITGLHKRGLEVGAPADFIVLSGDPFNHTTVVESTWIDGVMVFQ